MKKVCDILGDLLWHVFDKDKKDHIDDLLASKNVSFYGMIFFGFTSTKSFSVAISGCIFEILKSVTILHYITTNQDVIYNSKFKRGFDKKLLRGRGLGKVMMNVAYCITKHLNCLPNVFVTCFDTELFKKFINSWVLKKTIL